MISGVKGAAIEQLCWTTVIRHLSYSSPCIVETEAVRIKRMKKVISFKEEEY
jgi:hypothetical protein